MDIYKFLLPMLFLFNSCELLTDRGYYFSRKVPDDVVPAQEKYLEFYDTYKFPQTKQAETVFNNWWQHGQTMGKRVMLPLASGFFKLKISPELSISFRSEYQILYHYNGKNPDVAHVKHARSTNKYDLELMDYIYGLYKKEESNPGYLIKVERSKLIP
ncbi:hypothetical protein QET93_001635 [Akkermansia sp. N21116]|uniref:hypothetical protein n=1 Tax=Akkermansia sp. N21116 TaxID=3040764 RepID=UPI00244EAE15|nr:hypothetical protein [Akkermansia sp. N21116]WPX40803.1 hypothetical protein QET93_001635 [Akkermansia sp. N21116]